MFIAYEPVHEMSNNVVCATSKGSDQPAHTRSLLRAFASCLSILWLLSYRLNIIWSFYAENNSAQALLSLHLSKCHMLEITCHGSYVSIENSHVSEHRCRVCSSHTQRFNFNEDLDIEDLT